MFDDLPENLKNKVLTYLNSNNFKAAKQIHDCWMSIKGKANTCDHEICQMEYEMRGNYSFHRGMEASLP